MGISCIAYAISDANIARVLADPPLVWRLVEPGDEGLYLAEIGHATDTPNAPAPEVPSLVYNGYERYLLDLDQIWDGLGTCLKACAPRMPCFFDDAQPLSPIDVGYGPVLYHKAGTMARIARACSAIRETDLLVALHEADFAGVYLEDVWERRDSAIATCLKDGLAEFRAFAEFTALHKLGAVIHMS